MEKESEWMSVKEVVELLDVSRHTVYDWIKKGVIEATQIENTVRVNRKALLEKIEEGLEVVKKK